MRNVYCSSFVALFLFLSLTVSSAQPLHAKAMKDLRQAEKISYSLTGEPLSDELRKKFLKGEMTLEQIFEASIQSPAFVEYYAQFWTKTIGVQSPMDPYEMRDKDGRSIHDFGSINGTDKVGVDRLTDDCGERTADALRDWRNHRQGKQARIHIRNDCEDAPRIEVYSDFTDHGEVRDAAEKGVLGHVFKNQPVLPGTQDLWRDIYENIVRPSRAFCGDDNSGKVMKVWWDPDSVRSHARYKFAKGYRVPPWVEKVCGPMLQNCGLNESAGSDVYMDEVARDMSMEAGYLISHTVAENKPFTDILTTKDTIITGTYAYFLKKGRGRILLSNFPGGNLEDYESDVFKNSNLLDSKRYRVKRGELHAGVLTTPVFQSITNGRRAKANRAYETFLCRKFVVPDGVISDPNDASPDLTKRTYCQNCHKSLEPMAAFFNRWPDTGNINYQYNADKAVNDTGRYDGQTGQGALAFGQILVQTDEFVDCSVKRAFEFVNGRKMNTFEAINKVSDYKAVMKSSNMSMKEVFKKMVLSEEFLSPGSAP